MDWIEKAVRSLKAEHPHACTHGLHPLSHEAADQTVEYLIAYAERHEVWGATRRCMGWMNERRWLSMPTQGLDSYGYKHEVEFEHNAYVPHFAMLVGAVAQGRELKPNPERTWAALINIGAKL